MPEAPPVATGSPPVISEHVEVKVYPPTPERDAWFVLMSHRFPGGQLVTADEFGGAYTPGYVGRKITTLLEERFMGLEPF